LAVLAMLLPLVAKSQYSHRDIEVEGVAYRIFYYDNGYTYHENGSEIPSYFALESFHDICVVANNYSGRIVIPETVTFQLRNDYKDGGYETITQSVNKIDIDAFKNCKDLTSITFPKSLTSFGYMNYDTWEEAQTCLFSGCDNLSEIIIDEDNAIYDSRDNCVAIIKTEGNELLSGCKNTIIPNSITSIASFAFYGCSGLTSVTIPSSVTCIGGFAFYGCGLTDVYCLGNAPEAYWAFEYVQDAILHVNGSAVSSYTGEPWSLFKEIVQIPGTEPEQSLGKCAAPTVSVVNGEIVFACEMDGVQYHYEIKSRDQGKGDGNNIKLKGTYRVKVYASKDGYEDSDVTTKEIKLPAGGDVNGDGVINAADIVSITNLIMHNN